MIAWCLQALAVPPEQLPPGEPLHELIDEHWRIVYPEGAQSLAEDIGWRITAAFADDPWPGR
jgi:hypothetical protein